MNENVKNRLIPAVIFIVVFAIAFFATKMIFSKDVEGELSEVCEKMNADCPKLMDAETRLDSTKSLGKKTVQYNMTLVNVDQENPKFDIDALSTALKANCQETLDTKSGMEAFRSNDVAMNYNYNDKNGKTLFSFTVKPTKPKT